MSCFFVLSGGLGCVAGAMGEVPTGGFRIDAELRQVRQLGPNGFFERMDYQPTELGEVVQPGCAWIQNPKEVVTHPDRPGTKPVD